MIIANKRGIDNSLLVLSAVSMVILSLVLSGCAANCIDREMEGLHRLTRHHSHTEYRTVDCSPEYRAIVFSKEEQADRKQLKYQVRFESRNVKQEQQRDVDKSVVQTDYYYWSKVRNIYFNWVPLANVEITATSPEGLSVNFPGGNKTSSSGTVKAVVTAASPYLHFPFLPKASLGISDSALSSPAGTAGQRKLDVEFKSNKVSLKESIEVIDIREVINNIILVLTRDNVHPVTIKLLDMDSLLPLKGASITVEGVPPEVRSLLEASVCDPVYLQYAESQLPPHLSPRGETKVAESEGAAFGLYAPAVHIFKINHPNYNRFLQPVPVDKSTRTILIYLSNAHSKPRFRIEEE
jgi:hypothetical protein